MGDFVLAEDNSVLAEYFSLRVFCIITKGPYGLCIMYYCMTVCLRYLPLWSAVVISFYSFLLYVIDLRLGIAF